MNVGHTIMCKGLGKTPIFCIHFVLNIYIKRKKKKKNCIWKK